MCSHDVIESQTWKINTFSADSLCSHISALIGCQVWSGLGPQWAPERLLCFLLFLLMDVADGLFRPGKSVLLCYLLKQHLPPPLSNTGPPAPSSTSSPPTSPLSIVTLKPSSLIGLKLLNKSRKKKNLQNSCHVSERKILDLFTSWFTFTVP